MTIDIDSLQGHLQQRAAVRVTVHSTVGPTMGLMAETESLLRNNPAQIFTLRDVLKNIRPDADAAKVSSVLCKLLERGRVTPGKKHNGIRTVNTYQYKAPDGKLEA